MTDIDLYEFKKTLKEFENDKFIDFVEQKGVAVLEVGKKSEENN
jgi:predicted flavoprotein YhiN